MPCLCLKIWKFFSDILKIIDYLVVWFVIEIEEIPKTAKHQGNYFNCLTSFWPLISVCVKHYCCSPQYFWISVFWVHDNITPAWPLEVYHGLVTCFGQWKVPRHFWVKLWEPVYDLQTLCFPLFLSWHLEVSRQLCQLGSWRKGNAELISRLLAKAGSETRRELIFADTEGF